MNYFFEESVLIHWADCSEFQQPNGVAGHEGRHFGNRCRTLSIFAGNVRGPTVFRMDWLPHGSPNSENVRLQQDS